MQNRVPLIISGKGITEKGKITNAFTFVTDITPTILEIAGVKPHQGNYQGRRVEPIVGKSLLPLAKGEVGRIYSEDDAVGYELGGNAALFKGDYKIVKDRGPVGDNQWHLFNIVTDPGETKDLKKEMPKRFSDMMAAYRIYAADNKVLPVAEDYDQIKEVRNYSIRTQVKAHLPIYVTVVIVIIALSGFLIIRWFLFRRKNDT